MPTLVDALKTEIVQVAQKTLRGEAQQFKKATATYDREIAALQRRIDSLERLVISLRGQRAPSARPHVKPSSRRTRHTPHTQRPVAESTERDAGPALRFSTKGFTKMRQRLGLSAAAMGTLLGVTAQSVYKWEDGKARPRATQLQAIAAVRKLGKRAAAERLAEMEAATSPGRVTH